jgi:hypothetical protein
MQLVPLIIEKAGFIHKVLLAIIHKSSKSKIVRAIKD